MNRLYTYIIIICLLCSCQETGLKNLQADKNALLVHTRENSDTTIVLPINTAIIPKKGTDSIRHLKKTILISKNKYQLVFIGNSIIHTLGEFGGKYKDLKQVWLKHLKPLNALNLGYSGYRTENILWNLKNGELNFKYDPKLIVLLIGTNNADNRRFETVNTAEEIAEGTREIVNLIRQKLPATKILILRIFPRGGDKERGIGKNVFHSSDTCINTVLKTGLLTKALADNKTIFWKDINDVFLKKDGSINEKRMPDLLHPNAAGAEAWVAGILPEIKKLLE
jgi:lysophospholipase L1-like esterase